MPLHDYSYKDLSSDDVDSENELEEANEAPLVRHSWIRTTLFLVASISIIFVTTFGGVTAAMARHSQTRISEPAQASDLSAQQKPQYESCGRTVEEARARGCLFDLMSFVWLTPECFDAELNAEFLAWSNWTWYTNEDHRDLSHVSFDVAQLGEQKTWVDWNYHVVHCTFMWRMQHRFNERAYIGKHLINHDHTKHCQHVLLMDAYENRNTRIPAEPKFPYCVKVGLEKGTYPGLLRA